jgi:hypothetical protein
MVTGNLMPQGPRALSQQRLQRLRSSTQNVSMSIRVSGPNRAALLQQTTALATNITANASQFVVEVQAQLQLAVGAAAAAAALADATVPGGATVVIPTPTPQPAPLPNKSAAGKGLSGGAVSGIVIGTLAFIALVVAAAVYYKKRHSSNAPAGTHIQEYGESAGARRNKAARNSSINQGLGGAVGVAGAGAASSKPASVTRDATRPPASKMELRLMNDQEAAQSTLSPLASAGLLTHGDSF